MNWIIKVNQTKATCPCCNITEVAAYFHIFDTDRFVEEDDETYVEGDEAFEIEIAPISSKDLLPFGSAKAAIKQAINYLDQILIEMDKITEEHEIDRNEEGIKSVRSGLYKKLTLLKNLVNYDGKVTYVEVFHVVMIERALFTHGDGTLKGDFRESLK